MGIENENVFKELLKKTGGNLNTLTKSVILTLTNSKNPNDRLKGLDLKKDYLENVIEKAYKTSMAKMTKEKIEDILKMEELDLEIQQTKIKTIKAKLEELNGIN